MKELLATVDHIGDIKTGAPTISGIHHSAYRCRDAGETRKFYVDILGLEDAAALAFDKDPAGNDRPYMHLFFKMGDGNFLAFFDEPNSVEEGLFAMKDGIEDYHFAFEVASMDEQAQFKQRLEEAKVPVFGPIDHGFCHSVYFFDPNGLALEITVRDAKHDEIMADEAAQAKAHIEKWSERTRTLKQARLAQAAAE
ncbi:VOC family protein [Pyruvatibacter mobilis]|uniref:VOC family protein n=1 Tax=Pyruvatibacter mobilis TaxID=1712261 RepID=A0A845QCY0_9HYPH|nr:VOC family protein [Pyruvatibacter mobilis]NBG96020.1 VOC family protein [Pyruvatibacter mobilis]QJD75141.1 VOC family protein [Pyruvatibacter mobilis]GGD13118.1 glyoxalase [Pyruvatibacter mobilis]